MLSIVHLPNDKLSPVEDHEWVETVVLHMQEHDVPYLDKVMQSDEFLDDLTGHNLSCVTGDENGYIPQWIIQIFNWLSSYKKGDKISDLNMEHLKTPSSAEDFPSNLLTRLMYQMTLKLFFWARLDTTRPNLSQTHDGSDLHTFWTHERSWRNF